MRTPFLVAALFVAVPVLAQSTPEQVEAKRKRVEAARARAHAESAQKMHALAQEALRQREEAARADAGTAAPVAAPTPVAPAAPAFDPSLLRTSIVDEMETFELREAMLARIETLARGRKDLETLKVVRITRDAENERHALALARLKRAKTGR